MQHDGKSVDTNTKELRTFIGMNILMGIVKLHLIVKLSWSRRHAHSALSYWSQNNTGEHKGFLSYWYRKSEYMAAVSKVLGSFSKEIAEVLTLANKFVLIS